MKITKDNYGFYSCDTEHLCNICDHDCKVLLKNPSCNKFKFKEVIDEDE